MNSVTAVTIPCSSHGLRDRIAARYPRPARARSVLFFTHWVHPHVKQEHLHHALPKVCSDHDDIVSLRIIFIMLSSHLLSNPCAGCASVGNQVLISIYMYYNNAPNVKTWESRTVSIYTPPPPPPPICIHVYLADDTCLHHSLITLCYDTQWLCISVQWEKTEYICTVQYMYFKTFLGEKFPKSLHVNLLLHVCVIKHYF